MRIFVISDSHGSWGKAHGILSRLKNIDLIIHLGDGLADGIALSEATGIELAGVNGNMDSVDRELYKLVNTPLGTICISHGHELGVNYGLDNLINLCHEHGSIAGFYGHTHIPFCKKIDGLTIFNPGSISKPMGGNDCSYGIVTVEEEKIHCSIVYDKGSISKKKPQAGYLRSLINHSDGF